MAQTFYIDGDEEIISVVSRVRQSPDLENFLVFPRRALVLQSVVNLKLLDREASKLGKRVIVVTVDEEGRKMAEKAGLLTKISTEDFRKQPVTAPLSLVSDVAKLATMPRDEVHIPRSEAIGSSGFFDATTGSNPQSVPISQPGEETVLSQPDTAGAYESFISAPVSDVKTPLRVRDLSPPKQTSLNSARLGGGQAPPVSSENRIGETQLVPPYTEPISAPKNTFGAQRETSPMPVASLPMSPVPPVADSVSREHRLKSFFSPQTGTPLQPLRVAPPITRPAPLTVSPKVEHHASKTLLFLGLISILSFAGVGVFLFFPKASVSVVPRTLSDEIVVPFSGGQGADRSDTDHVVPVNVKESDEVVSFSVDTSGNTGSSEQKARGTVVITNEYSSAPQVLVATTRLSMSDGKTFRLVEGVTVPGITTVNGIEKPGVVEAAVIADQSGAGYNLDSATFTIPGFNGGPKYAKFSAKLTKSTVGGGASGSTLKTVAKADLDQAEKTARDKASAAFQSENTGTTDKLLVDSIDMDVPKTDGVPVVGSVADSFEYKATIHIRGFLVPEDTIRTIVMAGAPVGGEAGVSYDVSSLVLTYIDVLPDYATGSIRFQVKADRGLTAKIDIDGLKADLLGKDENGIKDVLARHNEVSNISVDFRPALFVKTIPKDVGRVFVTVGNAGK